MGAANVIQHIGLWEGIVVGLADIAKGSAAILIARAMDVSSPWVLGAGIGALLGHNFPVSAGFKGGKGSATALGVFLVLAPGETAAALGIMAIPYLATRNFAFSIAVGFTILPFLIWFVQASIVIALYSLAIVLFIGVRSLPNAGNARPTLWKRRQDSGDAPRE